MYMWILFYFFFSINQDPAQLNIGPNRIASDLE